MGRIGGSLSRLTSHQISRYSSRVSCAEQDGRPLTSVALGFVCERPCIPHGPSFPLFPGFQSKSRVLGKVFVFVALFDYKHFLLRRRIRTRGSCIHARPHDHGIWFDTVWDGFVIWVLAVKLDSGYIGGHLGPLQSLTPSNFQYPPVSKTPSRVARVKSLIHDNQTLANFPLHPQSQHWASGCGPMWRSNRVLSNLRIGAATDARAQRSSRAVRTLARSD